MKVYKNYFKILWTHKVPIILYTVIFLVLLMFFTRSEEAQGYESVAINIYVDDEAQTDLSKGLVAYLAKTNKIKDIDRDLVEDKLFYQNINVALEIPKDFAEEKKVLYKAAPGDIGGMKVKEEVNKYLSQVESYLLAGFSMDQAISNTNEDLEEKFVVAIRSAAGVKTEDHSAFYFNFLNYLLLSQVMLIVAIIVKVYKKKTVAMRNLVSPLPKSKMNFQLMLGHVTTGLGVWFLYMLIFVILYKYDFTRTDINLMMVNSLVFALAVVAMAVMFTSLIKNDNAVQGLTNVLALGSSFLCGAFVPQKFLGSTALKIGKIFPSYYYIKNNNLLEENPSIETIKTNLFIILAYALAFIIIFIVSKPKTSDKIN